MTTASSSRDKAFRLVEFFNPRSGTISWRVTGHHQGRRFRENHASKLKAESRRMELELERLGAKTAENLRATWLSPEQLKAAESVFTRHPDVTGFLRAFAWWEGHGAAQEAAMAHAEGLTLDQAAERFQKWLAATPGLRELSKKNLFYRVRIFTSELGDVALAAVTPELIEKWLDGRKVSPVSRNNDLRAVARFFGWCCERPQRFLIHNPAVSVRVALPEAEAPKIYTLRQVMRLLVAARRFRNGKFLKFIVLQLFGGMRPTEAVRYRDEQLVDGHITLTAKQTKTGRSRTFAADPVLLAWLKECPEGPAAGPQKNGKLWRQLMGGSRRGEWITDGLRHTSISHYFRRCGSFGLTAEHHGNSEAKIKAHYLGRVSIAESLKFWNLFPLRRHRKLVASK